MFKAFQATDILNNINLDPVIESKPSITFKGRKEILRKTFKSRTEYHCKEHGLMEKVTISNLTGRDCTCCMNSFVMIARRRKEAETMSYECGTCDLEICLNCINGK